MNGTGEKVVLDTVWEFIPKGMEIPGAGKTVGNFEQCESGSCLSWPKERGSRENVAQFIQEEGGQ